MYLGSIWVDQCCRPRENPTDRLVVNHHMRSFRTRETLKRVAFLSLLSDTDLLLHHRQNVGNTIQPTDEEIPFPRMRSMSQSSFAAAASSCLFKCKARKRFSSRALSRFFPVIRVRHWRRPQTIVCRTTPDGFPVPRRQQQDFIYRTPVAERLLAVRARIKSSREYTA